MMVSVERVQQHSVPIWTKNLFRRSPLLSLSLDKAIFRFQIIDRLYFQYSNGLYASVFQKPTKRVSLQGPRLMETSNESQASI